MTATKKERKVSNADKLLQCFAQLTTQGEIKFFNDDLKQPWCRIQYPTHCETYPIASHSFKKFALKLFFDNFGKLMSAETLKTALLNLEALLPPFSEEKVNLRTAFHDECLYYDLCSPFWEVVKITPNGWEVIKNPPVHFKRFPHQKAQVIPSKEVDIWQIKKFLNLIDSDSLILFLIWLVSSFIPDIPHPIPILYGSQGSAKTFHLKIVKELLDPSALPILSLGKDGTQIIQQLSHHLFLPYDNVSFLPDLTSDVLCRAITGEGFSKRKLWTDDDDVVYSYRRIIALNGINCAATQPDLLDRSILLKLPDIPKEKRKNEKRELWAEFYNLKPQILGGIFGTLSKALKIYPQIILKERPRMADFTEWGYAIAEALKIKGRGKEFLQIYDSNLKIQDWEVIESNPVALCILEFMRLHSEWKGSPTSLLQRLTEAANELEIDTKSKTWVKDACQLSRKLNKLKINLKNIGITYETDRDGTTRYIVLRDER